MLKSVLNLAKLPLVLDRLCIQNPVILPNIANGINSRFIHLTSSSYGKDRREHTKGVGKKDEGVDGEHSFDINDVSTQQSMFPDINTPNRLFNGIPFKQIPIVNIKCTRNNTLMTLTDFKGVVKICHTCGAEGFRTAKKGTNIAAQATAITLSERALEQGYKTIRVRVRGLGPGRSASLTGLQLGGMDIISITDYTKVTWHMSQRPRKVRRV